MREKQKNEQGITLIALIVTIIILLLLAGITINLAFNKNGILGRADQAKEMQEIGKLQDQIMIAVARYETDRIAQYPSEKPYEENIKEFKEDLKSQEVIEGVEDVEAPATLEKIEEESEVVISTKEGYEFEISLEKGTAKMGEVYYDSQTTVKVNITSTTNSITVKVVRPKDKELTITGIKDTTDGGKAIAIPQNTEKNKVVISNLPSAHIYEITMKVEGIEETITKKISTGELGNINEVKYTVDWTNKTATVTVEKEGVGEINWTIGDTGVWNKVEAEKKTFIVPNIEHGMAISFKLTEGISEKTTGETITIKDNVTPKAEITVPSGSYIAGGTTTQVDVTVKISDNESGLKLSECKYVIDNSSENYQEDEKYTQAFSAETETQIINIPTNTAGEYYLHILTVDKAGNKTYTVSSKSVKVINDVANWNELAELAKQISNDPSITNTTDSVTKSVNGKQITLNVGDIKKIEYNNKTYRTRVLGFNHDSLTNANAYGSTTATGKAGISFEFLDCISIHQMNPSDSSHRNGHNIGGWEKTSMRIYLQGEVNKIPESKYFKEVKKKYIATYNDPNSVKECSDKLWLLSASEVVDTGYGGENTRGYAITTEGEEYQYYRTKATEEFKENSAARVKYWNGKIAWECLRSPYNGHDKSFCGVDGYGMVDFITADLEVGGAAPGFAI